MSLFQKYLRVYILGLMYAATTCLPYIQYKFYDVLRDVTETTNTQLGYLITVFTIVAVLTFIPGGILATKMAPRKILISSAAISALYNCAFALYPNFYFGLFLWATLAAVFASTTPCLMKCVRESGCGNEQGKMFGIFIGSQGLSMLLITFVSVWVYELFETPAVGFKYVLYLQAGILLFCIFGILLCVQNKTEYTQEAPASQQQSIIKSIIGILKSAKVWTMILLMFTGYGCYITVAYLTPYTTNVLGLSVSAGALLAGIRQFGLKIIAGPLAGSIADKLGGPSRVMMPCFILGIAMYIAMMNLPSGTSVPVIIAMTLILSLFYVAIFSILMAAMEELRIPQQLTALVTSIVSIIGILPDAIFPPLYGFWLDKFGAAQGYTVIFCFISAISFIGFLIALRVYFYGKKAGPIAEC